MMLAQPAYLWAFLALSIPIAIHLLSRKEGRVIPMGSLRHLHESASQQFRGIKLNELVLLALRLWVLLLFVLLLAGLMLNTGEQKKWLVYDPILIGHQEANTFADSLQAQGYEWHWMATGFPTKDQSPEPLQNYWQVINELKTQRLSEAVVVSASLLKNFNGALQPLPDQISWQTFELPEHRFSTFGVKQSKFNIVRNGISNSSHTRFVTDTVAALPDTLRTWAPIQVAIQADKGFESETRLVEASLTAIKKILPIEMVTTEIAQADWVFWLSGKTIPATQANVIVVKATAGKLLEQVAAKQWRVHDLTMERAIQENFTVQLASLLTTHPETEQVIAANDRRSISSQQLTTSTQARAMGGASEKVSWPLFILFLVSLVAERILAFVRRQ
ncbi:MAG: hypothetical protein UZ12_BCD005002423 [Bacteroidetes bacterium OLB12]|nr:MAG: hypothetical protein UZ12_BCD005002423 [Bacteroidetes bacterium OLB12]HNR72771.1 BatA domain-containing protein [Cyclobacteriaceae bacterium]HNU42117.1 BatA domain-containing protein [Cyclobacteriaceae bacterium]